MSVFNLRDNSYYSLNVAVKYCNDILLNPDLLLHDFLQDIESKKFDMSTATGDHIASRILKFISDGGKMNVVLYKPKNPWSRAYGYYTKARPFDININVRKMRRPTSSFVATLIHEMIHAIDGLDVAQSYGHGDNSSASKADTAPYWVGTLASKLYGQEQDPEQYPRTVRTPWYKRFFRWF